MSIFGNIMTKIFHHPAAAATAASAGAAPGDTSGAAPGAAPGAVAVDVGAVLSAMASAKGGGGNYQSSIVDLLKLLGLDSNLSARKTLAGELHYDGDTNDSASMNVWLIRQVMSQLAANGGKVPPALMN